MIYIDCSIVFIKKNEDVITQNEIVLFYNCIANTNIFIGKL